VKAVWEEAAVVLKQMAAEAVVGIVVVQALQILVWCPVLPVIVQKTWQGTSAPAVQTQYYV